MIKSGGKTQTEIWFAYNKCSASVQLMLGSMIMPTCAHAFAYSTTSCQSSHPIQLIALKLWEISSNASWIA